MELFEKIKHPLRNKISSCSELFKKNYDKPNYLTDLIIGLIKETIAEEKIKELSLWDTYYFIKLNCYEIRFSKECKYDFLSCIEEGEGIVIDFDITFPELKSNMYFLNNSHVFLLKEVIDTNIPEIKKLKEENK